MKKWILKAALWTAVLSMLTACGAKHVTKKQNQTQDDSADQKTEKYAMVLPESQNAYYDKLAKGFSEVMEKEEKPYSIFEADGNPVQKQEEIIQSLIEEDVSCIAIAPADANAIEDILKEAMQAGIDICSFDSPATPTSRELFINQTGTEQIAVTLMDSVLDISGGMGEWAILSSQSNASGQNEWIDAMKEIMEDEKYHDLEMVEIAYADEQYQRAYDQTKSLLQNYPDLKVIVVTTTDAIAAVCEAVRDAAANVKVTGFGLPSEMQGFVGSTNICPYFYLWNPSKIGELTAYVSMALHRGVITGALGEKFTVGGFGEYEVTKAKDDGTEIIVGYPYKFDEDNISQWDRLYGTESGN